MSIFIIYAYMSKINFESIYIMICIYLFYPWNLHFIHFLKHIPWHNSFYIIFRLVLPGELSFLLPACK